MIIDGNVLPLDRANVDTDQIIPAHQLTGIEKTVRWYLDNPAWWGRIRSGVYRGERLGAARDNAS